MIKRLGTMTFWLENSLMVLLLTAMILLAVGQIILRNVWDMGLSWSDPLLRIMVLWVGLLGAMAASRQREHISIDVLSHYLPVAWKRISRLVTDLFSAAICGLISYHAARFVLMEKEEGMIAFANVPAWWCEIIIPIAFGVMALRFFLFFLAGMTHRHTPDAAP